MGVTWQALRQRGPDVPQLCSVSRLSRFCLFTSAARFSAGQSSVVFLDELLCLLSNLDHMSNVLTDKCICRWACREHVLDEQWSHVWRPEPFETQPPAGTPHHRLTSHHDFFHQVVGSCCLKMEVTTKASLCRGRSREKATGSGPHQVSCGDSRGRANPLLVNHPQQKLVPPFWTWKTLPSVNWSAL